MLQSNRKTRRSTYARRSLSLQRRWSAINNNPSSPLQAILGGITNKPPVSEVGVSPDAGSAQAGMRSDLNLAAKELVDPQVSGQHTMNLRAMSDDYQSHLRRHRSRSKRKEPRESSSLDIEKEIVVLMEPKSRRSIKLQVTSVKRAEPRIVIDSPDI